MTPIPPLPPSPDTDGPRFPPLGRDAFLDRLTGLAWCAHATLAEFPLDWPESLAFVAAMNRESRFGHADWRLPNRRELRSLLDMAASRPALPGGHPFRNVFQGWYWTSTTAAINPACAWRAHLAGARMFYGRKTEYALLWPVRGAGNGTLAATGQRACFDVRGKDAPCPGTGQDGELRLGAPWPAPRFEVRDGSVLDRLTGLAWRGTPEPEETDWQGALDAVERLKRHAGDPAWRLPHINELESLVDASRHTPALPPGHPFQDLGDGFWSGTDSAYEPGWAWVLYLDKGAVGVGHKAGARFRAWAVRDR